MRKSHWRKLQYDFQTKEVTVPEAEKVAEKNRKKKWIIYARVSTEEQKRKGDGIQAQTIDCDKWAEREDVEVVAYFKDEAISGTNLKRAWFLKAIRYVEDANKKWLEIDYFICWATSRFSRSPKLNETFEMAARVEATWAKLVAVGNWGIQDLESEEWLLSFGLNSLVDAIESLRWKKRVRYWNKGKIYEWLRPFPAVPVGYKRIVQEEWGKEIKYLVKDEPNATILKEWLELFAEWIILTKQQLFEFYVERWLTSNSKKNKSWKLHRSILDQILDLWKLLVYTWNLTYPEWWITEIIPAKHPAIISPEVMHKIVWRLEKDYGVANHKKKKYDEDADEYPLKRILLCPECDKAVTKRKSKSHTWDYHHYYWCNNKECHLHKKSLPRDEIHEAVRDKLQEITPPKEAILLFEETFIEERELLKKDTTGINKDKKKKIAMIEREMDRLERSIDRLSETENPNMKLIEKKQENWAELQAEKEELERQIEHITYNQDEMKKVFDEAKAVIANPVALWDLDDVEIKQLLIRVCFNNKIYYKKNQGLHTPEISLIYLSLSEFSNSDYCNVEINTNLLHPLQSSLMKNQFIFSRINTLLELRGYSTTIS